MENLFRAWPLILLSQIITRVMKLLTLQGYLVEEQDRLFMAETDTNTAMAPLQSAACTPMVKDSAHRIWN
jgi:hypothetical protein